MYTAVLNKNSDTNSFKKYSRERTKMTKISLPFFYLSHGYLALFLITAIGGFSAGEAAAQRIVIDFNDSAGLLAIPGGDSALFTFANFYREDGMIFTAGINSPGSVLAGKSHGHYHLSYEDENITGGFVQGKLTYGRQTSTGFVPVTPENENRTLSPHLSDAVIQMIYDPNNDGVPDPFDLISLVVHTGTLNVGTKSTTGRICVYNDLTGGFEWGLTGDCATNLTLVTLEALDIFNVDRIIFAKVPEPSTIALLTPGILGLLGYGFRQRKRPSSNRVVAS
jgi:hypothetical protein